MTERAVLHVPTDDVEPDPDQPRKSFSDQTLCSMAATMKTRQLQPILARRRGGKWVIIDGERRWRAAKLAGLATIDVLVMEGPAGVAERRRWQLIANLQREDIPPLEKAAAIQLVMSEGKLTLAQAANELGESPGNISKLLAVASGPQDVQDAVKAGLPMSTAYELARIPDAALRESLIEQSMTNGFTRDDVSKTVAKFKRVQREISAESTGTSTRATAPLGEGRSITVNGKGLTIESYVEWLELLVSKARRARTQGISLEMFIRTLRDQAA